MGSKNFRLSVIVRSIALAATLGLLIYLIAETTFYASVLVVGIVVILQVVALIRYVEGTNTDLARFLRSIQYEDVSQSFVGRKKGRTFDELAVAFSDVMAKFRKTRQEAEEHHLYLQTVVQHVGMGLLAFTPTGEVQLLNAAAKRLLNVNHMTNLRALADASPELVRQLKTLKAGEKALIKVERNNEMVQLALAATEFRLRQQQFTLVTIQNIRSELEEREMEAYQKLIRVLTHEIMNSITPISSLASTVNGLLNEPNSAAKPMGPETLNDIRGAVETIEKRSQGLLRFVEAYRNLTRIPKPRFKIVRVRELFDTVEKLMRAQTPGEAVKLTSDVTPETLEVTADPDLIEQVLINLLLNSIHAVSQQPDGRIRMTSSMDKQGHVVIDVIDNGPGFSEEAKDKIFVPFFTTKKEGSGIGLSLSKEIMRQHRGAIHVRSGAGKETVFRLVF